MRTWEKERKEEQDKEWKNKKQNILKKVKDYKQPDLSEDWHVTFEKWFVIFEDLIVISRDWTDHNFFILNPIWMISLSLNSLWSKEFS